MYLHLCNNTSVIETFIVCKSSALGTVPGTRTTKMIYHSIINWEKRTTAHLAISYLLLTHKSSKNYSPDFIKITFVNRHSTTGKKDTGINKKRLLCLWAALKWALWGVNTKEMHCGCQAGLPLGKPDTRLTSHTNMSLQLQSKAASSGGISCDYACLLAMREKKCDFNSLKVGI